MMGRGVGARHGRSMTPASGQVRQSAAQPDAMRIRPSPATPRPDELAPTDALVEHPPRQHHRHPRGEGGDRRDDDGELAPDRDHQQRRGEHVEPARPRARGRGPVPPGTSPIRVGPAPAPRRGRRARPQPAGPRGPASSRMSDEVLANMMNEVPSAAPAATATSSWLRPPTFGPPSCSRASSAPATSAHPTPTSTSAEGRSPSIRPHETGTIAPTTAVTGATRAHLPVREAVVQQPEAEHVGRSGDRAEGQVPAGHIGADEGRRPARRRRAPRSGRPGAPPRWRPAARRARRGSLPIRTRTATSRPISTATAGSLGTSRFPAVSRPGSRTRSPPSTPTRPRPTGSTTTRSAQRFGFRGGLVPGVDVYAYLTHPPAAAWGRVWLEGGSDGRPGSTARCTTATPWRSSRPDDGDLEVRDPGRRRLRGGHGVAASRSRGPDVATCRSCRRRPGDRPAPGVARDAASRHRVRAGPAPLRRRRGAGLPARRAGGAAALPGGAASPTRRGSCATRTTCSRPTSSSDRGSTSSPRSCTTAWSAHGELSVGAGPG